ncbi:MAG: Rhs element Vgr protein [Bacteroidetes bacterium]|nr:Rhs element Vgr protein [Bacteroidota bacterium]
MGFLSTLVPKNQNLSTSSFSVTINGAKLKDTYAVSALMVTRSVNKIPFAQLILLDGDVSEQDYPASSSETFIPGAKVEILMGHGQKDKKVFSGIIIKHSIQLLQGQPMMLTLELKDETVKLTVGRKNKFFENKTDDAIIKDVLKSFAGKLEPTTVQHEEMVQYFCTDWDFVMSRADVSGQLVFVEDGKVNVNKPDFTQTPKLSVVFGANVYEFEAEMDARDEYKSVEASSWDDATRKIVKKTSKPPVLGKEEGNPSGAVLSDVIGLDKFALQHSGQVKDMELESWASAKLLRSRMAKIKGRARIDGYNDIKPGDLIGIDQFSKRFNGTAFVSSVMHSLSADSSYYTDIQFGYSQEWFSRKYNDITEMPASGLLPSVYGLQVGIVVKITEDPQNDYRVKVNLPMVAVGQEGVWARLANLDAGKERGSFFYPEVGDEVILGFMNDDPREPVILGMLYSKNAKGKPPLEPTTDNFKKGFYTKEKLKLEFDDDKKSVTIETPGGNKIIITDKDDSKITISDSNKNIIEMSKDGIAITSGKDLKIKAKGDITIEGVNITSSADSKLKAEGNGGVELSSSANAVIKGSVVQIN